MDDESEILNDPATMQRLAEGDEEIAAGQLLDIRDIRRTLTRRRLEELRARAKLRAQGMSNRPDTPEEAARQSAENADIRALQWRTATWLADG